MSDDPNRLNAAAPAPETAEVRPDEQMDWPKLASYLRSHLDLSPWQGAGGMQVRQFPGGSANLTYLVAFSPPEGHADDNVGENVREFVVRRPPLGPVAPGAHDMAREHRVLSRLWQAWPKAPRCYLLCEDEEVIGAPFIVTERRNGVVIRGAFPQSMLHHKRLAERTSFALVDAMAEMHNVDPGSVGLERLGRPDGFVARQVSGWYDRWQHAKEADVAGVDNIHKVLAGNIPEPQRVSVLHNDLKLDNCQFDPEDPDHVASVFDWDMATLGDPLVDLGTLLGYWPETTDSEPRAVRAEGAEDAFPTRQAIIERYASTTGIDVSQAWWFEAFALWKTSVVVQQIYIRYHRGQTQDERFATIKERIPVLVHQALELIEQHR